MNNVSKSDFQNLFSRGLDYGYFEGKSVFFAGATSFIASYMIEALIYYNDNIAKNKVKIYCLARNKEKAERRFKRHIKRQDLVFIYQDINAKPEISDKIDIIIHAASQASPKYYGSDPVGTFSSNVIGTHNLLEFARQNGVKDFLFISSGEVYGQVDKEKILETDYGYIDCTNVRACYSEGKRAGETLCVSYAHQYGINAKMARLYHTYGPNMPLDDGRVFADFFCNLIENRDIVMKSDGLIHRAFCYVVDLIDALMRIILLGKKGEAYNIANDNEFISIRELAERLVAEFKEKNLKVVMIPREANNNYIETLNQNKNKWGAPDIQKIRKLGFDPEFSIEEGFRKIVDYYEEEKLNEL